MSELTQQEIEAVKELLSSETAKEPLSRAQKWEVAKVVSAILLGGFALLAVGGVFVVKNAAEHGAASVAASDVASSLAEITSFRTAVSEKAGAIPARAVVAFDRGQGCPKGWTDFANARGRTIIGVGEGPNLSNRAFGEQGGEETVILTDDTVPTHSHKLAGSNIVGEKWAPGGDEFVFRIAKSHHVTGSTTPVGKGGAHNNMPPYVSLYYCIKGVS